MKYPFHHLRDPRGAEQDTWLARLAIEHDNLRAALGWCLDDEDDGALGLRLGGALGWLWEVRGHHSEGRRWLAALLARGGDAPPNLHAETLSRAGWLAQEQSDYDEAERLHEQSLALRRGLGDDAGIARALNNLGTVAGARGDYARAQALHEESLALHRRRGDRQAVATSLINLGIDARRQGEPDRAVSRYEESLVLLRELGDRRSIATALQNLGNAHRDQDADERAATRYGESLSVYGELGDGLGVARCLEGLAGVAVAQGKAEWAARLCGAATARRAAIGAPPTAAGRAEFDRTTAAARTALGKADFTATWAAGQVLSLEQAVTEGLAAAARITRDETGTARK